jgi:serine acetyltransferase
MKSPPIERANPFLADISREIPPGKPISLRNIVEAYWRSFGLKALLAYRLGRWLLAAGRRWYCWPLLPPGWLLYLVVHCYARVCFDIHLSLSARIGAGLHIAHFGNILVRDCQLGVGCSIRQSVRIERGNAATGPVIGDGVWFGAHAVVVGPYAIGAGSTVAAGAVVERDLPPRCLCIGNPGRILSRNYDNANYPYMPYEAYLDR